MTTNTTAMPHKRMKSIDKYDDECFESNLSIEIVSKLCRDTRSKIIEFCRPREWFQLSYTCKGINCFKLNRLLMFNKQRMFRHILYESEIEHGLRLGQKERCSISTSQNGIHMWWLIISNF